MGNLVRDLAYAGRMLRSSRGFSAVAILTLALCIGANTAIFSLVNTVLLRPFPFPDPERLAFVWEDAPFFGLRDSPVAPGNFMDWRAENRTFEEMGAIENASFRLSGDGEPEILRGVLATAGFFRALAVKPAAGRTFREDEDHPGAARVVVLSDGLWRRRFGGDPGLVGRLVRFGQHQHTVIGIMPAGFAFADRTIDIWAPMGAFYSSSRLMERGRHNWMVVGRLKTGVSLTQANQDLQAIAQRLQRAYPATNAKVGAFVAPLRDHFAAGTGRLLAVLLAAVGFVLLVGCANMANLLMARAASRQKDIAVRLALGAGRARIARQVLVESLVLAGAGGAAGLFLSIWTFRSLAAFVPAGLAGEVALDARVLGFTLALSVFTALLFGLGPALRTSRLDLHEAMKQTAGRSAVGRTGMRGFLVVGEMALALVLLAGAGLMIRTFVGLRTVELGFRTDNILTVDLAMSYTKYGDPARKLAFYVQALERVRSLPGVVSAGFINGVPVAFKGWVARYTTEDGAETPLQANYRVVTPDYLRTMGIPLFDGRPLNDHDTEGAPLVALANQTLTRQFWPNLNPIGRRFRLGPDQPWITVAGVVGDVRQAGLDVPAKPEMYFPYRQQDSLPTTLVVRTATDPSGLIPAVRGVIRALDQDLPTTHIATMAEILDTEVSHRRLQTRIFGVFAGLALLLAAIGIYGVLSFVVMGRTPEIGLRLALGARPGDILRSVVGRGMWLAGLGLAIGLVAAVALTRLMTSLLVGVSATDPLTFGAVSCLLLIVAFAACSIPALRAARTSPLSALRHE